MFRYPLLALATLLAQTGQGVGQVQARTESTGPFVVEREVRERWIQGGQNPGFVPFRSSQESIHLRLREARGFSGGRYIDVRGPSWEGSLRLDPRNRLLSLRIDPPALSISEGTQPGLVDPWQRHLGSLRGRVTGLWEVPVVLPGERLAPGVTWTDTLSFSVAPGEAWLETLDGIWRHQVVGDTLVNDRRLPLVQTTAEMKHRSFEAVPDAGIEGNLVVERTLSGQLVGRMAVDTVLGLRALGVDSSAWEGVATLHTQDGRSFDAPLEYQRIRVWRLADSAAWAVVQDSVRAERRRQDTGMLAFPVTEIQERLQRGDSALGDSLRTRWKETDDPNERWTVEGLLRGWGERVPGRRDDFLAWLEDARLEFGDTATLLAARLDGGSWLDSLTGEDLDELLPYLDDLGRLWEIGVTPRWTYSTLATGILDDTPLLEPDTANWNCTPAACERVISLLETASEPRLRDVALVAAFARDPAAWYERLRTRADSGSLVVREALQLGDGVGTTRGDMVPPPDASWRAWLSWMGGEVRFRSSHANALRMYEARTGRDVVGELRRGWPAQEDSARVVLGTILREMGGVDPPTLQELADELLSGSIARVAAARAQLFTRVPPGRIRLETPDSLLAPTRVFAEVLPVLLDSLLAGGRSPWPGVGPDGSVEPSVGLGFVGGHGARDVSLFLLDENLPPGFVPDAGSGFELIDQRTWDARAPREGGVLLTVAPLTAVGPFAALTWEQRVLERRGPEAAPSGFAGGGTIWVLRTDGEWTVVSSAGWTT